MLVPKRAATVDSHELLGLFPWIGADRVGGVELSGRLAWAGLTAAGERTALFCYAPFTRPGTPLEYGPACVVYSQSAAIRAALGWQQRPATVLIWHIGMLRLLPLFRVRSARVALFLHGIEVWRRHDPLTRLLLRRVKLFVCNSQFTWDRFLHYYPALATRPHTTVHLGAGDPVLAPALPPGEAAALILGRLARGEDYKGHRELIAAWPLLQQRLPGAVLWVAGDGDLRPDLERLAQERGLGNAVRFFGQVSEQQKQDLLARCSCLAMPSRGEGFGLVYLEAMRLGRPCLVSTLDAGREVINPPEAGLAADPHDPHALAAALARLMAPGIEWNRWSAQARARYEERFTAQHFQQRLIESLRSFGSPL
jgi:phosphatidylinositol alpha-1,6-mannosyltransferase